MISFPSRAIRLEQHGGPEQLRLVNVMVGDPGPGEIRIRHHAVGQDTWDKSLDCLAPFGLMVGFGHSSGPVAPFALSTLSAKGSLYVTRPTLFPHTTTRENTQAVTDDLFGVVARGQVTIRIDQRYPLAEVQHAHRDIEARRTTGCSILTL